MTNKTNFEPVILTAIKTFTREENGLVINVITKDKEYKIIGETHVSFTIMNDLNEDQYLDYSTFTEYFTVKMDPIVENIVEKLRRRATVGISKYGTTLDANNQDNFLKHLQEELFDASNYIEKIMRDQNIFEKRQENLFEWFNSKDLIKVENSAKQFMKINEELGELSSAIIKDDRDAEIDAFGDVLITLIGLSFMRDLNLVKCLDIAWNEIKDRKGKVVDGSFIRE